MNTNGFSIEREIAQIRGLPGQQFTAFALKKISDQIQGLLILPTPVMAPTTPTTTPVAVESLVTAAPAPPQTISILSPAGKILGSGTTIITLANGSFTITYGTRANVPASGNQGAQYYETDVGALYLDNGTHFIYETGVFVGTDTMRAAIASIGANDNGLLALTTDLWQVWRVEAGAWVLKNQLLSPSTGIGNGANANLQAPGKSTGTGPASLVAVAWAEVVIANGTLAGQTGWIPIMQ